MPRRAKIDDYVNGKKDEAGKAAADDAEVAALAKDILAAIEKAPLYYTDIAEKFAAYNFRTVARAHRPPARDREALAGPARPHVRARLAVRGLAAEEIGSIGLMVGGA